jgi:hypothetical protein
LPQFAETERVGGGLERAAFFHCQQSNSSRIRGSLAPLI